MYVACCLRAVERDPDEQVDTIDPPKKNVNNNTCGRSNNTGVPRVSTNLVETMTDTVSTAKTNNPTYNYNVAERPNYSQYVYMPFVA